ncbi:MAG: RidA family protein [Lautropia sp.]|nr:RidA family protein [Lautropia sp.]
MDIKRLEPGQRMSEAVVYNHVAYLAGQIPEDTSTGAADQTRQVLTAIDSVLARLGTDKSRLLSATVYLSSIGNFAAMNEAWDAWVAPGQPPARATVEARLASPDILVEIVVTAAVD